RDAARLFLGGEGPSGSSLMRRSRAQHWIAQNTKLLRGSSGEPPGRAEQVLSLVLTTVIGEAGREIATAGNEEGASESDEEARRSGRGRNVPWAAPGRGDTRVTLWLTRDAADRYPDHRVTGS